MRALKAQLMVPDEIIVIRREGDTKTEILLQAWERELPLAQIIVNVPGQVAALNAGLDSASGDIVAITDDDTVPHPEWLQLIEAHFQRDPGLGGLGGRDWVYAGDRVEVGTRQTVGKVRWSGKVIGNHHLGAGGPREVDVLKGANMSYRREAIREIRFDENLLGSGAQVHNDMAFSLAVKGAGWRLTYDPAVAVDHHPAPRFDEDQRAQFNRVALHNAVYNETLALLNYLSPGRRIAFAGWSILVGKRVTPGLLHTLLALTDDRKAAEKLITTLTGRREGWRTWRSHSKEG